MNYRKFFSLVCTYLAHGIFSLNLAISVFYMDGGPDYDGDRSDLAYASAVLAILSILIEFLKIILSSALLVWHIYLSKIGITTYQYLVEREELEKVKT